MQFMATGDDRLPVFFCGAAPNIYAVVNDLTSIFTQVILANSVGFKTSR